MTTLSVGFRDRDLVRKASISRVGEGVKEVIDSTPRIVCKVEREQITERDAMQVGREKFGAFIRREREARKIGLREMARQIKVSPTFLSKVETENWKPGEDKLRKIAGIIGCDADELVARAGRVPSELSEIIRDHPHRQELTALLRTTKGMTAEDIGNLVRRARKSNDR